MRVARYAIAPVAATALALTACGGGDSERTYDVAGEVTDKQIEEECDNSHALGAEVMEVEPVSFEGRSSSGSGSSSSGGGESNSSGGGGNRSDRNNPSTSGGSGSTGSPTTRPTARTDCHTEYEIFVRGEEDDVDVTSAHYDRCAVGEQFPACTGNGQ